ncbi:MAG: SirB2 family protein [Deltaproteobacteria bacterium]|jgi:hypothetical protein|nr:SirB2 family protein [Deltaproteobacteria bacterium]
MAENMYVARLTEHHQPYGGTSRMKTLGVQGRKVLKICHLCLAGIWLGGAVTLNIMVLELGPAESGPQLNGYDLARMFVDDYVITPAALGCLLSGLLIGWLTPWGFFKHRWVTVKLILTIVCILVGTFALGPMINDQPALSLEQGLAALRNPVYASNISGALLGGIALVLMIIFMTVISVLKPWQKKNRTNA